jgi:hypothetical protein
MAVSTWRASRWLPWSALVAALSGEGVHHQLLSDLLRFRCEWGRPALGWAVTAAVLLWMLLGAVLTRAALHPPVMQALPEAAARNRRFIAHLGWLACALLAIAVCWQMLAVLWMPSCP